MLLSEITGRVANLLNDAGATRWTAADLIEYYNDFCRWLLPVRKDAYTSGGSFSLAAGIPQTLPAGSVALINILYNLGVGGATPGATVNKVDIDEMSFNNPDWTTATSATAIESFMFDPNDPLNFYVSPPSNGTGKVYLVKSLFPAALTAVGDTILLSDEFKNPAIDYMMHRCLMKNSGVQNGLQRAIVHYNLAASAVGAKTIRELRPSQEK